jgi:predicted nucleic acid-binding protein
MDFSHFSQRFAAARKFMLKHLDQAYSFTDCVSFVVMKELHLIDALATDHHFRIVGFNPLLVE